MQTAPHFNMSKTGFVSQLGNDATKANPRDVLVDESIQADIENLGDCLRALDDGQSLGDFSATIVLYGQSRTDLDPLVAGCSNPPFRTNFQSLPKHPDLHRPCLPSPCTSYVYFPTSEGNGAPKS